MALNEKRRPLILVVDIDNDIADALGTSMVVGYDNVKKAALEFGTKRPEDADVNAILAGLKLYKELSEKGLDPEIAVVGGHKVDSLAAQRNIKQAVARIVEKMNSPVEFYIVSDGEDEFVISQLLHEYGSIAGFYRVIVEQHLGIEGGYLLVLKYLKKAAEDPRYSKYLVGIPGIALLLISITALFNMAYLALELLLLLIGSAMIIVGFNLERPLEEWLHGVAQAIWERPHFHIVGLIVFILLFGTALYSGYQSYERYGLNTSLISEVSRVSIPLLSASIISYLLINRVFIKASRGDLNLYHEAAGIIVTLSVALAFYNMGVYLRQIGPNQEITLQAFLDSGFIQYIIIGTGIAALIELTRRVAVREKDMVEESISHSS